MLINAKQSKLPRFVEVHENKVSFEDFVVVFFSQLHDQFTLYNNAFSRPLLQLSPSTGYSLIQHRVLVTTLFTHFVINTHGSQTHHGRLCGSSKLLYKR